MAVLLTPAAATLMHLGGAGQDLIASNLGPGAASCALGDGLTLWFAPAATETNPRAAALTGRAGIAGTVVVTGADPAGRPAGLNRIQAARLVASLHETNPERASAR